jgi:hypothetical protein
MREGDPESARLNLVSVRRVLACEEPDFTN